MKKALEKVIMKGWIKRKMKLSKNIQTLLIL